MLRPSGLLTCLPHDRGRDRCALGRGQGSRETRRCCCGKSCKPGALLSVGQAADTAYKIGGVGNCGDNCGDDQPK